MKKKMFIIDGKNFSNIEGFYDEVQRKLTIDFPGFGRNLDAFDDILYGGDELFKFKEKIVLRWKNFNKSKKELPSEFLKDILEIIKHHNHIELRGVK